MGGDTGPELANGRVRVVLAEDEAIIRLDLKETLEDEGYEVVGDTGRGDHAVQLVGELNPDVVILDVKMPGLDGIEAARRIAASHDTAVVILTAFSQRELIDRAIEAGALAYLVKPFSRSELVPALEIARTRHREMRALTDQARTMAERLEARKLLDRAKGILIDEAGLTEGDAFRFIQTTAMSGRQTMADVARAVLSDGLRP
ncbi:MAG: response regulator [Acidimicrobiales bacterium]|jgi:response regulator NasT|nr:response regulator [Gemmatimonadota bacterium]HAZ17423.1 response regulator [Acidimicrobiaceae bacterium]HBA94345.1 response regulator [Acidimicrobiaceae bacterium]HIE66859.1 response regulator [Acidimicrobiia bacterium]HIL49363.1 response regulator [Acidimicrobiia bacterium]|tara:strand:+ start:7424 stop:8032 length:609 start_codon:yes stop_codon:yes gene_type:complete